jgi:hypothetical protein
MPVWRFSSFDEARRALMLESGDPRLPQHLRRLWRTAARLAPGGAPRGVRKFTSIEEANAEREAVTAERIRRLRAERALP